MLAVWRWSMSRATRAKSRVGFDGTTTSSSGPTRATPCATTFARDEGDDRRRSGRRDARVELTPLVTIASRPALAFDGTNYLVVWSDQLIGAAANRLRGTRVSTAAAVDGQPDLALSAGPNVERDLRWRSTARTIWWSGRTLRNGSDDIYAARVMPTGASLDRTASQSRRPRVRAANAEVAFDGTNYLVVWQDFRNGTDADIYGARVSQAGALLDAAGIALATEATISARRRWRSAPRATSSCGPTAAVA